VRYYGVQNEVKSYLNRLQSEEGIEVSLGTVKTLNDRVEALKKSGVWSQYGLGFNDRDADSYFQRATVRDAIGRFEVCLFVRGMKTLGLWQNMVSWPMRSYQNAGTGSTVYSLGGLGTFDGTLFNAVTWGTDGMTDFGFNGAANITLPTISLTSGGFTFITNHSYVADNNRIYDVQGGSGVQVGLWANYAGQVYFDTINSVGGVNRLVGNGGVIPTAFNFLETIATPTGSKLYRNGISKLSDNVSLNNIKSFAPLKIGFSATYTTLKIPFVALLNIGDLTTSTYNLYKNTLGNGLGLT